MSSLIENAYVWYVARTVSLTEAFQIKYIFMKPVFSCVYFLSDLFHHNNAFFGDTTL